MILVSTIDNISTSFCLVNKYSKACGLSEVTFAMKKVVPVLGLADSMDFLNRSVSLLLFGLNVTGLLLLGSIVFTIFVVFTAIGAVFGKMLGTIPCLIRS